MTSARERRTGLLAQPVQSADEHRPWSTARRRVNRSRIPQPLCRATGAPCNYRMSEVGAPTRREGSAQVVAGHEPVPHGVRAFEAAVRDRSVQNGATGERASANLTQRPERASECRASFVLTTSASRRGRAIDNQAHHDSPLDSRPPSDRSPAKVRYIRLPQSSMVRASFQAALPSRWCLIRHTTSAGLTRGFTR